MAEHDDPDVLSEKEASLRILSQMPVVLWTTDTELRFHRTMSARA